MAPGSLPWSISSWNAAPIRSRRSEDRPTFSGSTVGSERPQAALAAKTKTNTRALILFTVHLPAIVRRPSTSYSRHVRRFKWQGAGNRPDLPLTLGSKTDRRRRRLAGWRWFRRLPPGGNLAARTGLG